MSNLQPFPALLSDGPSWGQVEFPKRTKLTVPRIIGRNFAMTEIRIMVVLLILNFEFLELDGEYASMSCHESMFREANAPYASIRPLRSSA